MSLKINLSKSGTKWPERGGGEEAFGPPENGKTLANGGEMGREEEIGVAEENGHWTVERKKKQASLLGGSPLSF